MKKTVRLDKVLSVCDATGPYTLLHPLTPAKNTQFDLTGIFDDSRLVCPGGLFAALKGHLHNGEDYIPAALKQGASTILTTPEAGAEFQSVFPDARFICSPTPRKLLGPLATLFYDQAPRHMAAVTGTNGKTSVADFCRQLWETLGYKSASIGTLGVVPPQASAKLNLTTPGTLQLHNLLQELAHQKYTHVALEASSHGLDQYRLDGLKIDVAAFTNLSHDHLDYHKDMAHYFAAKARLFKDVLAPGGIAVLNADTPEYASLCSMLPHAQILSYGKAGKDLTLKYIEPHPQGQRVSLTLFGAPYQITVPLIARFQIYNLLCSIGMVLAHQDIKATLPTLLEALPNLSQVPGRMEWIVDYQGGSIYTDFAHTPDALLNALKSARHNTKGKLIVVFGCGGDRDPMKRAPMGRIAGAYSDVAYITDDNPRNEDPTKIREEILTGAHEASHAKIFETGNREDAIRQSIESLSDGDTLIIAGKGHEEGQIIGGTTIKFNDADMAREIIRALG